MIRTSVCFIFIHWKVEESGGSDEEEVIDKMSVKYGTAHWLVHCILSQVTVWWSDYSHLGC